MKLAAALPKTGVYKPSSYGNKETRVRKTIRRASINAFCNVINPNSCDENGDIDTWASDDNTFIFFITDNPIPFSLNKDIFNYRTSIINTIAELSNNTNVIQANKLNLMVKFSEILMDNDVTDVQYKSAINAISLVLNKVCINDLVFKYSIENEVVMVYRNDRGNHYLIIGDEDENDISYGFVGTKIGEYNTAHLDTSHTLDDLVNLFVNG
ncbi:MAG: hypothetical protein HS119_12620 [Flavobacteriales bacterium]|nr:hypothetical protein [Flavobacteriales bacterium]MCL4856970.1 hypothetical protein [Flavobacteriales bacterium]